MTDALICAVKRTPIGRFGGVLAGMRTDDLAAHPIKALMESHPSIDWRDLDEVVLGCANQAGEDNRNVARMAVLLSGLPVEVAATTMNRLCGSGMDAVALAARAIRLGEADLMIAGGVESMSRAPFVMPKAESAFSRETAIYDTTIGWRFVNKAIEAQYGIDSMPETAENLAEELSISRDDQDAFAWRSQDRAAKAQASGRFGLEVAPVTLPARKGDPVVVERDEHPRATTIEALAKLKAPFRKGGSVTAGNASGVNDGAAALLIASPRAAEKYGLTPLARIKGFASAGCPPRIMGIGPVPATRKLLDRHDLTVANIDLWEMNEAFAAQVLACARALGLPDDAGHINPNGGAIALGHPLGMTGARIAGSAAIELARSGAKMAVATMCVGVGQGVSLLLERA
ncbi:beta-ketoadipyl CoA thiolase [Magnetospirillum sp. LM-5]|uniref:3-oxoadipyl-CoA thiolase n=1 Tax=Magnetospirillum sp. LM-5 TaxID=2681466 RepID=UPI0013804226|nr:3-oxoadipyl-CoA thiolase [Magnetospirillum sp. LM-5]CAA7616070.1 beta-ketoadipyl CoA thiolase [Magnetospirillum sp. LM-5]